MIKATPVITDEFWILKEQDQKVGEISADSDGSYSLRINGRVQKLGTDLEEIKKVDGLEFDELSTQVIPTHTKKSVYGFPADSEVHNPVYDVKRRIAFFTKSPESRSWHAAGYFKVKQYKDWEMMFCPKMILLDRYDYFGPAKDPEDFEFK